MNQSNPIKVFLNIVEHIPQGSYSISRNMTLPRFPGLARVNPSEFRRIFIDCCLSQLQPFPKAICLLAQRTRWFTKIASKNPVKWHSSVPFVAKQFRKRASVVKSYPKQSTGVQRVFWSHLTQCFDGKVDHILDAWYSTMSVRI